MKMWIVIMWTALFITGAAWVYVSNRVCRFGWAKRLTKDNEKKKALLGGGLTAVGVCITGFILGFVNAMVCLIYFALAWLLCDSLFWAIEKLSGIKFLTYYAGAAAVVLAVCALVAGWYYDHNVWQTNYVLKTEKNVKDLRMVAFADAHLGTTFDAKGFAKHVAEMEKQNPDVVLVVGDFVDDGTSKEDMVEACRVLGNMKTKYGVYFVFGNHDKGYYGAQYRGFGIDVLVSKLLKNNVRILQDEAVQINDDFYIVGRRDFSEVRERRGYRQSMQKLMKNLEPEKFVIVADHQPADFDGEANAGADLVIAGHTHGGQLFPFNGIGKWIGANDEIYGLSRRKNTDFIVTSGISAWAIKFKTGTKSEFVVADIKGN